MEKGIIMTCTSVRGSLARTMYSKLMEDFSDSCKSHSAWYSINHDKIDISKDMFLQFYKDEETIEFIENCRMKSDSIIVQLMHSFLKFFLTFFMSSTSANGLLHRGSMFVLSSSQFQQILCLKDGEHLENLLDLGAGDGAVTERLSKFFRNVHVTEMSRTMTWRLKDKGYKVLDIDGWKKNSSERYDVIACMNLLDRCDRPIDLLEELHNILKEGTGKLILAIVLPLSQYVEAGDGSHMPKQKLHVVGKIFEEHLSSLVNSILRPAGYELERYSKVPYLCEGDLHHSYYVLHDAILLLRSMRK